MVSIMSSVVVGGICVLASECIYEHGEIVQSKARVSKHGKSRVCAGMVG